MDLSRCWLEVEWTDGNGGWTQILTSIDTGKKYEYVSDGQTEIVKEII